MRASTLKSPRAFTVIELLVVVAIVAFLLSMIIAVGLHMRRKAQISHTKTMLKDLHLALDQYRSEHREYPAGLAIHADTWPAPFNIAGVEFDHRVITERKPGCALNETDKDPADRNYLVDPWGNRIRYRKLGPTQMLLWSKGPDGKDQIGADVGKMRERAGLIPVDANGNIVAKSSTTSDDISHLEVDF